LRTEAGLLQRVHGGAVPRSAVAPTYAEREGQSREGKLATARAAVRLLEPGQVAIVDGGTTALALVEEIPPGHRGTFVTHSPPVAAALGRRGFADVVVVGGTLDPEAMVAVGATRPAPTSASPPRSASSASGACTRAPG
jgi:DeoR/GlpR family transcriptional regulator of sugar metabolism